MDKLFNGLMGGPIFANSNRVVSEDIDHRELHECAQAKRPTHVIDEDEESRTKGADFDQTHSIEDGAHGMLANSEVKIASSIVFRLEVSRALKRQPGLRRGREICSTADQPRDVLGGRVQHFR